MSADGTSTPMAFPVLWVEHNMSGARTAGELSQEGMTLRDYFAGQALMGKANELPNRDADHAYSIAAQAYLLADAMMAAREVKEDA